jgi:hypothetical protein
MQVWQLRKALENYAPGAEVRSVWGPVVDVKTHQDDDDNWTVIIVSELEANTCDSLPG